MKRALAGLGIVAAAAVGLLWFRHAPAAPRLAAAAQVQPPGLPSPAIPIAPIGKSSSVKSGTLVVAGGWGGEPGQFGRRRDPESNPEAPMAIAAVNGEIAVVDQLNRRVQRFKDGKLVGTVPFGGDTVQDLTVAPNGKTVLLDRLVDGNVQVYGADGKLLNQVPIVGKGIDEGGDVTGVFADDQGIYVEREHGSIVRVADADGKADPDRPELLGRPSRDGRWLLQVEMTSPSTILVRATDRKTADLAWVKTLATDAPILHVVMLDSDRHGNVYAAVEVGRESGDFEIADAHITAYRLSGSGAQTGALRLPALGSADETFRPMSVDDDGTLYLMLPTDSGLQVFQYSF